jgi:transposase
MARAPLAITLSQADRTRLEELLRGGGVQQTRVVLRALALRQLAAGDSAPQIAKRLPLTAQTIRNLARRYEHEGLERALHEKERPGAAPALEPQQQQRIIAMVCADPPRGYARWTVRLVAQEAVKRRLIPRIGRETIRILLQHHDLKPWREKNVVRTGAKR